MMETGSATDRLRSKRQLFGDWKRSSEGKEVIAYQYRRQRGLCVSCLSTIVLASTTHTHHCFPISFMKEEDIRITSLSNLVLLCAKCNLKQSNKIDTRFD